MTYIRGKIVKLRPSTAMPELDASILNKMRPYTIDVQKLHRNGDDLGVDSLVTRLLSRHKSLLEITEEEVDMYSEALIFEEY